VLLALAGCAFFVVQSHSWPASALDVDIYRAAARSFLSGRDVYAGRFGADGGGLPFTYPPLALLVFVPLALLASSSAAAVAMFVVSGGALVVCVRRSQEYALPQRPMSWWSTVALAGAASYLVEPVRTTLGLGQINLVLLALVLGVDAAGRRAAGVGAGLAAAVKVTPALLVAAQAVRGDRRAFVRGVVAFAACTGLAAALAPAASWQYFSSLMWQPSRAGGVAYIGNQSLRGVWERAGAGHSVAAWALSSAAVLAVATWAVRRHRQDAWLALTIAAVAGLLVSPISWTHHWVWALPVAAVGVRHRHRHALATASALFLLPCLAQVVLWNRPVAPSWSVDMYAVAALVWLAVVATVPAQDGQARPVRAGDAEPGRRSPAGAQVDSSSSPTAAGPAL